MQMTGGMDNPWDQRYQRDDYVYGTQPNTFLASEWGQLPRGRVLCVGEGEGRNAVYLARQGFAVTAVDASAVGLQKARRLADAHDVSIDTVVADLADYPVGMAEWDAVVSIFCHLPPTLRRDLHRRVVAGLRPGGVLLLEAYTPRQLEYGTGGPPSAEMMMTLDGLRSELAGLEFLHTIELDREVREGCLHTGTGAVVQVIARRPAGPRDH